MKIKFHENTGLFYITTETSEDLFRLGKLSTIFPQSSVYPSASGPEKELTVSKDDLLAALLKK